MMESSEPGLKKHELDNSVQLDELVDSQDFDDFVFENLESGVHFLKVNKLFKIYRDKLSMPKEIFIGPELIVEEIVASVVLKRKRPENPISWSFDINIKTLTSTLAITMNSGENLMSVQNFEDFDGTRFTREMDREYCVQLLLGILGAILDKEINNGQYQTDETSRIDEDIIAVTLSEVDENASESDENAPNSSNLLLRRITKILSAIGSVSGQYKSDFQTLILGDDKNKTLISKHREIFHGHTRNDSIIHFGQESGGQIDDFELVRFTKNGDKANSFDLGITQKLIGTLDHYGKSIQAPHQYTPMLLDSTSDIRSAVANMAEYYPNLIDPADDPVEWKQLTDIVSDQLRAVIKKARVN